MKLNLDFIRRRRLEKKLTLQEMAELMGFKNASTYMKYEKGDYSFKAEQLPALANVLGCEIDNIFFENEISKIEKTQNQPPDPATLVSIKEPPDPAA